MKYTIIIMVLLLTALVIGCAAKISEDTDIGADVDTLSQDLNEIDSVDSDLNSTEFDNFEDSLDLEDL